MVTSENATPLWLTPLLPCKRVAPEVGHYEVVQRVITKSPDNDEGEIETALEIYFGPNKNPLWRRVIVRSGPACPTEVVHASFELPPLDGDMEDFAPQNALCWTAFAERPYHKLLCVLANPTLLCIWDVYPRKNEISPVGEGHSISLPFEATAIHPIQGGHSGLLIQRKENVEDYAEAQNKVWNNTNVRVEEEDDSFVLKAPPKPVRTSIDTLNVSTATGAVPSLFSLSHPLDDVLPCADMSADDTMQQGIVTDVFEKVLFVGEITRIENQEDYLQRREYSHTICVTYHTQRRRHAIWEICSAPPPPPPAPLWKVSSQWRADNRWSSHIGVFQQDLEDMELLGASGAEGMDPGHYEIATRNDALADALGIRKTPRKTVEDIGQRHRNTAGRSVNRGHRSGKAPSAANNLSLLSPMSRPGTTESTPGFPDVDTSIASATVRPPLLTMGPFASLSPELSFSCLFEESTESLPALDVFIASSLDGSCRQTVCLVCPKNIRLGSEGMLKLFEFERQKEGMDTSDSDDTSRKLANLFQICPGASIPCISAVPIETSTVPFCFHPHRKHRKPGWKDKIVDILLLREQRSGHRISLFRSSLHIGACAILQPTESSSPRTMSTDGICSLEYGVGNRLDAVFQTADDTTLTLRVAVPLEMKSGAIHENMLSAIESSILPHQQSTLVSRAEFVAKVRFDCVRLEQEMKRRSVDDYGTKAILSVLTSLLESEHVDRDVNATLVSAGSKEENESNGAWDRLLSSDFHEAFQLECQDLLFPDIEAPKSPFPSSSEAMRILSEAFSYSVECSRRCDMQVSSLIIHSLHFLYENYKLFTTLRDAGLRMTAKILKGLCSAYANNFFEYYCRDMGGKYSNTGEAQEKAVDDLELGEPFSILASIDQLLSGQSGLFTTAQHVNAVNAVCRRTISLIRIYGTLYMHMGDDDFEQSRRRDLDVAHILVEEGFEDCSTIRDSIPTGVALPILEVLHRCRAVHDLKRSEVTDVRVWSLIGREDQRRNSIPYLRTKHEMFRFQNQDATGEKSTAADFLVDKDADGITPLEYTSSMLFPEDNRIREVGRLLRSSRPVYLNVPRAIEVTDHDYERLKQEKLLLLSCRILALPLGRGMLTTGNLVPVPAEPLPFPELCLVGRVPPTNAMLALDTTECPVDLKVWPDFHNGVAAGLRLPCEKDAGELVSKITRTWIVYNRPGADQTQSQNNANAGSNDTTNNSMDSTHGGLLMALGLRGHLTTLEMTDIFDYLTQGSITTTVGVLLGMAANMRGTCDISVSKMLCLHIPSLIPQHFSAIDVASCVQAAAVSGTGILYQGSSHRMMTEFLLNEIGKRPSTDTNLVDREAYTLSCGIALGMVNLGKGQSTGSSSSNAGLTDLRIEERLYRYIVGGLDDAEMRHRRDEGDRLSLPTTSASSGNEKSSCVFEGDSINTDITAPGATLALGLVYMMSGNETIASAIALPDTHFLLEYVRPDFLMLRVIARSLILWDDVEPSQTWIQSQLPVAVKGAFVNMKEHASYISGQSMSPPSPTEKAFDRQAIRLIYAHIIAGACFSVGLRFAGTGNRQAAAAIFERVMELKNFRDGADPVSCALRPPVPVLEMCLGATAISLSMVMAGTGDMDTLKLLKMLRWRCDDDINYGSHMAYGSAIGLLFLGGGTCTLGRDAQDIAALVMAFYPRFPASTSDNQYHLQALRHLYSLAVKKRDFRAIDVDTGASVYVPIEVSFDGASVPPTHLTAPCLLLNSSTPPRDIRVVSERYYPVALDLKQNQGGQVFFVKRRSVYLNYKQDPDSKRSLMVQSGSLGGVLTMDLISSFTDDRTMLAFARHFCGIGTGASAGAIANPFSLEGFSSRVLSECLLLDTQDTLPLYLSLWVSAEKCRNGKLSSFVAAWDFRLIRSYYAWRHLVVEDTSQRILNSELVLYLGELLESYASDCAGSETHSTILYREDRTPTISALEESMDLG